MAVELSWGSTPGEQTNRAALAARQIQLSQDLLAEQAAVKARLIAANEGAAAAFLVNQNARLSMNPVTKKWMFPLDRRS